jgi:hypothetical protein
MRKGTEDILKDRSPGHPSHPASEHVSGPVGQPVLKTPIGSALPESWVLSNTFTETDKLSFFDVAHDAYAAGQHIRPNDPNKPEGEWNYPPTDTVLETAGLQLRKTFDADATLHSVSLPNDTPYIPAMFGIPSFSLYRYAWYPLSSLTGILTLVYVFVRYRYK